MRRCTLAADFNFSFDRSRFTPEQLDKRLNRAIFGVARYWDGRCEAHMKQHAPWTDRTSNARNGLFARAVKLGRGLYAIILAHSVTYGIYLEVGTEKMEARPIIVPTMELFGPKVTRMLRKILDRI